MRLYGYVLIPLTALDWATEPQSGGADWAAVPNESAQGNSGGW